MSLILQTAKISLGVQLATGVVTFVGFFLPDPSGYEHADDVRTILGIEGVSQLIEFAYYATVVFYLKRELSTWTRYIDWFLSTPVMLVSTAMFFVHRDDGGDVMGVFERPNTAVVLTLNASMLSVGFVMELGALDRTAGVGIGSVLLIATFAALSRDLRRDDSMSVSIFFLMLFVWFAYGLAALFSYVPRNVGYNLLDLVSKNFYGLFLFVYFVTR